MGGEEGGEAAVEMQNKRVNSILRKWAVPEEQQSSELKCRKSYAVFFICSLVVCQ